MKTLYSTVRIPCYQRILLKYISYLSKIGSLNYIVIDKIHIEIIIVFLDKFTITGVIYSPLSLFPNPPSNHPLSFYWF